jgi:transcriptional regulator with PAS, ATPase and Fis domain
MLASHSWPGNLRELRHEMQRASVLVGDRQVIETADFAFPQNDSRERGSTSEAEGTLPEKLEALERREIERALANYHANRTHAAEALGITRRGLLKKMTLFGFS